MKYSKKLVSVLLAASLVCLSLVGCGQSSAADIDYTQTVTTVNGEEISLGVVNFYTRYEQSYYETYYMVYFGDDMWTTEVSDGVTYEDDTKSTVMTTIQELAIIRQHADEYGVTLEDAEFEMIQAAAEEFVAANDDEALAAISGSAEVMEEVLELFLYDTKVYDAIAEGIDTEVDEEDIAQKALTYVYFELTTDDEEAEDGYVEYTDEEKAVVYAEIESLIAAAEESGDLYTEAEALGYTPVEVTFNVSTTTVDENVIAVADELSEGEVSGVIESDLSYYVAQLTSEYDEDATETARQEVLSEREAELYTIVVEEWIAAAECVIDEDVWSQISLIDLGVTIYYESTEE
ncbi:MAG: hypothetical protein R3Y40_00765 [Eubacteriales bacterium]